MRLPAALFFVAGVLLVSGCEADRNPRGLYVIAFVSDECGDCQSQIPALRDLEKDGLTVVWVNVSKTIASKFLSRMWGVSKLPTYIVVENGPDGVSVRVRTHEVADLVDMQLVSW